MKTKFKHFFDSDKRPKILVAGDLILDEYIWGNMNRISPEAPVPGTGLADPARTGARGRVDLLEERNEGPPEAPRPAEAVPGYRRLAQE